MKFVILFLFVTSVFLGVSAEAAKLSICFTGMSAVDPNANTAENTAEGFKNMVLTDESAGQFYDADLSCQSVKRIDAGIQSAVVTLSIGAAYSAISGVGVPVSAYLSIAAAGLSYADFWVSGMDCQEDKAKFEQRVKEAVCDTLSDSGVVCNPAKIQTLNFAPPEEPVCRQPESIRT